MLHRISTIFTLFLDTNECVVNNEGCALKTADCIDEIGSFTCLCKRGFQGNGTHCQGK